jgi:predicted GNAT family acetyltransferase
MFIDKLHAEDIDTVSLLIAEAFVTNEPLTQHIGIPLLMFQQWCTQVVKNSIKDNMCFVTKDQDNVITGCIIAEDIANTIAPDCCQLRPILDLLDNVAEQYPDSIINSKTLHLYLAATKLGYEGHGICYKLTQHLIQEAKKNNYNYVVSELTSKGTQHICINKLDFQNIYCCQYTDFEGFENLHGECILAVKSL